MARIAIAGPRALHQSAASQEMDIGRSGASGVDRADAHERLEGIRQSLHISRRFRLLLLCVRGYVCAGADTRSLCASSAVAWPTGARRTLRCACACLRTPQLPSRSSTAMAQRGKVCVWHGCDVAVRSVSGSASCDVTCSLPQPQAWILLWPRRFMKWMACTVWRFSAVQRAQTDGKWYCPCMLLRSVSLGAGEMCWPVRVVVVVMSISLVIVSIHRRPGRGRVLRAADKRSIPGVFTSARSSFHDHQQLQYRARDGTLSAIQDLTLALFSPCLAPSPQLPRVGCSAMALVSELGRSGRSTL